MSFIIAVCTRVEFVASTPIPNSARNAARFSRNDMMTSLKYLVLDSCAVCQGQGYALPVY